DTNLIPRVTPPSLGLRRRETLAAHRRATRRAFNKRFLLDLADDWQQHGREVFKRVRRESPAAYLKVCAMLVPKEFKVELSLRYHVCDAWRASIYERPNARIV